MKLTSYFLTLIVFLCVHVHGQIAFNVPPIPADKKFWVPPLNFAGNLTFGPWVYSGNKASRVTRGTVNRLVYGVNVTGSIMYVENVWYGIDDGDPTAPQTWQLSLRGVTGTIDETYSVDSPKFDINYNFKYVRK